MDAKDLVTLAERVIAAAASAKPSTSKLYKLVAPYRSKLPHLDELYENLDDLDKIQATLCMNHDRFLSRNTEGLQQLLEECCRLLNASNMICTTLYGILSVVLKSSASWGRMDNNQIQRSVGVVPNASAKLRISTMSLELLVKVIQLSDKTDDFEARRIEKAINEIRNAEPILKSKLKLAGAELTLGIQQALSQSVKVCDIVAEVLKKKQTLEIAENMTIKTRSEFTTAPQTAAKSRWTR